MAWFAIARILFVGVVAYAAAALQPLPVGLAANVGFALLLGGLVVFFESRLGTISVARVIGALIGIIIGLAIARAIEAGLSWANSDNHQVEFLQTFLLIVLPYLGLVIGAKQGEWLEPARLITLFR